jgi:membrane protein YqaA with SNARE-associated domain
MIYLTLLLLVILVNVLPAFAPPTWSLLVFFLVRYNLSITTIVAIGVLGATLGRFLLSCYINWFSQQVFNKKQEANLRYLGKRIGKTPKSNIIFTFIYALTPLSSTALFVAAGIARVRIQYVLLGFFFGRVISYTLLALSTEALVVNVNELFKGVITWQSVLSSLLGLAILLLFIFIDWKELLEKKKIKLNFNIWRWNEIDSARLS